MAGTEVAVGYVSILPKMGSGFTKTVEQAMSATGAGGAKSFSASFESGVSAAGVAAGNLITGAISTAMGAVTSSLDSAVSRVDTLNQFPKVMSNLGFSTDEADAALSRLSDGIQGLPTTLDGIVGNAQTLSLTLGDLSRGTDVALALNDGMLTYGASAEYVDNAVFQLNQMISAGSYDMQSWRSVMESAPGYLDQVAKACLGAGSSANDLRVALNEGEVTTEQFLDAVVRLDQEGGEGIVAFSEQAKSATGGIATSFANVGTAVTRNLANFIDAVNGEDNRIAAFADSLKQVVNDIGAAALPLGEALGGAFSSFTEGFDSAYSALTGAMGGLGEALFGSDAVVEELDEDAGAAAQSAEELLGQYQELFDQVWNGDWGNGEEARRQAFVDAGYSAEQYDAVQRLVNEHGADYVLTMGDIESALGDVSAAEGKATSATKKAERTVKEATKGALTPYIDGLRDMVFGIDETADAFDEFGVKVGTVTAHTDGLADDLSQFWGKLAESLGSGAALGESLSVAVDFAFDFPADVQASIDGACSALDGLSGKASDVASSVAPSAAEAWESFTGCLATLAGTSFDSALSFLTQVEGPLEDVMAALGGFASDQAQGASEVFDAISEAAPAISQTFTDALAGTFSDVCGALVAMEPAASALAGLVTDTAVALVGELASSCGDMVQPLQDVGGAAKSIAEEYGPKLAEFFEGIDPQAAIDRVAGFVSAVYWDLHGLAEYVAGPDGPGAQVAGALAATAYGGDTIFDAIAYDAETAVGAVTIAVAAISGVIGKAAEAFGKVMEGDVLGAITSFNEGLTMAVDGVGAEVEYLFGTDVASVMPGVQQFLDTVQDAAPALDSLTQACQEAGMSAEGVQAVSDALSGVDTADVSLSASDAEALGEALASLDPTATQEVADALGAVCQPAHDAGDGLQVTADELGNTCDAFDDLGDTVTMTEDEFAKFLDQANSDTTQIANVSVQKGEMACGALQGVADTSRSLGDEFKAAADRCSSLSGQLEALLTYNDKTVTVNVVTAYSSTGDSSSASSAGVPAVSAHALGGVTNGLHIVGEAGPEAIVPLYAGAMDPFSSQVADFIEKDMGAAGGNTYNVYVNGARINDDEAIRSNVAGLLWDLDRLGAI